MQGKLLNVRQNAFKFLRPKDVVFFIWPEEGLERRASQYKRVRIK